MGIRHHPRFTFWLTFFQSDMLPLFFSEKKNLAIMPVGIFLVFFFSFGENKADETQFQMKVMSYFL